jgi:hypothetical protein
MMRSGLFASGFIRLAAPDRVVANIGFRHVVYPLDEEVVDQRIASRRVATSYATKSRRRRMD